MKQIILSIALSVMALTLAPSPGMAADEDLSTTVKALKMRLRDQERRIAELENQQAQTRGDREKFLEVWESIQEDAATRAANDFRVYWKNGLRMDTADGRVKLRLGGRLMVDMGWIDGSGIEEDLGADLEDGTEVRRARLYVQGEFDKSLAFKWQYDFAGGDPDVKDLYLKFKKVPVADSVTVGHFKEPFSLEELTSSKYITFMERSLANVFAPGRNIGVMAAGAPLDERMTWAVGMFRDVDDFGETQQDDNYALTGRVTWLPWYEEDGRRLLHLGAAYSYRDMEDAFRYRQRPEAHWISQRFTDTGLIGAGNVNLFGGEAAMVLGPFSLQGEYMAANVDAETMVSTVNDEEVEVPLQETLCLQGFYVQASYFLTGEHRPYKKSAGTFGRVKPKRNYDGEGGWGAWQVAGRYSYLDLGDRDLPSSATRMQNLAFGLNWHLNPNTRMMWNYIRSCVDGEDISSAADIFMMRVQVDF